MNLTQSFGVRNEQERSEDSERRRELLIFSKSQHPDLYTTKDFYEVSII